VEDLKGVMEEICSGRGVYEATGIGGNIQTLYRMYPLRIYLRRFRLEREWRTEGQFAAAGLPLDS
jgi:hypothetical protein